MRDFSQLNKYLDYLEREIYPEPDMLQHEDITEKVFRNFIIPNKAHITKVLDVGCGRGIALKRFQSHAIRATGITLGEEDYAICRNQGFDVQRMNQSFLKFPDKAFTLVYARHVLEHSPLPLLTLFEFNRVLKNNSFLYVEVPWAESIHTNNQNHYSTLGKLSWSHLFKKANFLIINDITINFDLVDGSKDEYWGWWLKKAGDIPC